MQQRGECKSCAARCHSWAHGIQPSEETVRTAFILEELVDRDDVVEKIASPLAVAQRRRLARSDALQRSPRFRIGFRELHPVPQRERQSDAIKARPLAEC